MHYNLGQGFMRHAGFKFFIFLILLVLLDSDRVQASGVLSTCTSVLKASFASHSKARQAYLKESKAMVLDEPLVRYLSDNSINLEAVSHDHLLGLIREFRGSPVERYLRSKKRLIFIFDPNESQALIDSSAFGFQVIRLPAGKPMAEQFLYVVGALYYEDFISKQPKLMSRLNDVTVKSKKFSGEPSHLYAVGFSLFHGGAPLLKSLDADFFKFIAESIDAYGPRTLDVYKKKKSRP